MVSGPNKKHKILILSNSHPYKTAGIVALDLLNGLKKIEGNEVKLIVNVYDNFPDKDVISLHTKLPYLKKVIIRKIRNKLIKFGLLKSKLNNTNRKYIIQDYDQTKTYYSTERILKKATFIPDVVIVIFMQTFLSYKNLYEIHNTTGAKIFLYPMDMAPFTGGCHYAWDCKGYFKKCGHCPAYYSNMENDQSRENWLFNKEYSSKTNIEIIAGTEWIYKQIKQSSLFSDKPIRKILLPIDENVFKPGDKIVARRYFNLPNNKKIIFFGAVSVNSKRKGFKELTKALAKLKSILNEKENKNIHLMIAGNCDPDFENSLNIDHTILGYLNHTKLVRAYQAATVFVSPSIEDSGPMMINQAIMCGLPVVAFEMGVALDIVITGKTGYRAKLKDSEDLANGIKYILELDDHEYDEMSENCRNLALKLLHPKKQGERFIEIIEANKLKAQK